MCDCVSIPMCNSLLHIYVPLFLVDAAYRFYRSRCEDESAKRRGKLPEKNKAKRKHERIIRVSMHLHGKGTKIKDTV